MDGKLCGNNLNFCIPFLSINKTNNQTLIQTLIQNKTLIKMAYVPTHNFKLNITNDMIPRMIGKGGKVLFNEVVKESLNNFKEIEGHKSQELINSIKEGERKINIRINIKEMGDNIVATWKENGILQDSENNHNLNVDLNEIIKYNLVSLCEKVAGSKKEKEEKKKVFRQNFNYRMGLEDCSIGQFIGNGGEVINEFKKKIQEELNVEKAFIKILNWKPEMLEMYRAIGFDEAYESQDYFLFKISFLGGEKSDILKVEKMLIDFVNETVGDDDDDDDDDDGYDNDPRGCDSADDVD